MRAEPKSKVGGGGYERGGGRGGTEAPSMYNLLKENLILILNSEEPQAFFEILNDGDHTGRRSSQKVLVNGRPLHGFFELVAFVLDTSLALGDGCICIVLEKFLSITEAFLSFKLCLTPCL